LGVGVWGLGVWGSAQNPKTQIPNPHPQSPFKINKNILILKIII